LKVANFCNKLIKNKLECLRQSSFISESEARTYLRGAPYELNYKGRHLAASANARIEWKLAKLTNTLAYSTTF
jgi:hypothetical protein